MKLADVLMPFLRTAFNTNAIVEAHEAVGQRSDGSPCPCTRISVDGQNVAMIYEKSEYGDHNSVQILSKLGPVIKLIPEDPNFVKKMKDEIWEILCHPEILRRRENWRIQREHEERRKLVKSLMEKHNGRDPSNQSV